MSQKKADKVEMDSTRSNITGKKAAMVFDMPSCGGCCTCELACAFHHTGEFSTSGSSLRILDKEGEEGCRVELIAEGDDRKTACDGCEGLDVPLCMEYCREADDLGKILGEFEEKRR